MTATLGLEKERRKDVAVYAYLNTCKTMTIVSSAFRIMDKVEGMNDNVR